MTKKILWKLVSQTSEAVWRTHSAAVDITNFFFQENTRLPLRPGPSLENTATSREVTLLSRYEIATVLINHGKFHQSPSGIERNGPQTYDVHAPFEGNIITGKVSTVFITPIFYHTTDAKSL